MTLTELSIKRPTLVVVTFTVLAGTRHLQLLPIEV